MKVDVYALENAADKHLGSITWDGSEFHVEPDAPRLRCLLEEPVYDTEAGEAVTADDPERFLELMPFQYRSPYFRVGPVEEGQQQKAGKAVRKGMGVDVSDWFGPFLNVNNVRQIHNYDCGAACTHSVALYFNVAGNRTEADFIRELDTLPTSMIENGTRWQRIVEWFEERGIPARGQTGMTLEDLRRNWKAGIATIVAIQDYGTPELYEANESGHYVVVCGFVGKDYLVIQDPSAANAESGGRLPDHFPDSVQDFGKLLIRTDTFEAVWHDADADGSVLRRFGIAVGPAATGTLRLRKSVRKGYNPIEDLQRIGKELASHTNPAPMPGYGQIFIKENGSGECWYVGGDGDESGFGKLVEEKLRSVRGIDDITYEAESFPPKDEGWIQVYPREKPWKTNPVSDHKSLDAQGGEMPAIDPGMLAKADFITYPPDVKGSNCGNCQHNAKKVCQFEGEIAGVHLDLRGQPVSDRDCCIAWNAPGTLRDWKEPAATVRKSAPKAADADTDPVQTAELIADILGGLFGEEALAAFEETKAEREGAPEAKAFHGKAWDELKHPRGSNGRFIPKGSAEAVASAKAGIDDIRKLGASAKSDPAHAKKLADHLSILTVKQLRELQKEYGLKASAKLRDELVAKIIDRLSGAQERIDSERKEAAKQLGLPEHATVRDIVEHLAVEAGYPEHFLTKQELNEKLDELGVSVPVQRGEAVKAAFEVLRDGVTPKEPEKTPAEKASIQDSLAAADAGGLEAARDYWRNQKPASEVSQEEKDKLQEQFVTLDNEFLRRKEQWEAARELSNHVGSTDEEKQAAGDAYSAMLRVDDARKAAREWGTGKLPEKQTPVTEKPAPASVPEKPIPSEKPPARSEKKPEPVNEKKPESESKPEVPELEDWLDQEWSKIPKPQRRKLDPDEWNAAKTEEYQRLYGQQEPEPRYVSAADLRSRNPNLDLAAIGKLNREIRDLEMERQAGGAPGIPERAGLQERIDDLKNQRDRLAGVQPGESVSEYDMQELGREGKKPKEGAKKPAAEKIPEKPQNAVDDTSSGAYNASGGGEKPKPEEPKMDVHKIALLQHIASRAGGSVSESSLRSQLAGSGVDMGVALQELESAGLVKPAHSGDFRFWKPTKAGMQKVEEHEAEGKRQEAEKEANKREVLRWNSRKNTFDKVREDPQAIEAWRNTPNRVHIVQDADYQQDTSSLDYDRPVKTRIQSKPIGALMAEGVVADKRVIGGKVEYLLKPHTRTSRAQYEEQEKRRELARLERESRTDVDMRTEEQQSELNRRVADLRRELGNA